MLLGKVFNYLQLVFGRAVAAAYFAGQVLKGFVKGGYNGVGYFVQHYAGAYC